MRVGTCAAYALCNNAYTQCVTLPAFQARSVGIYIHDTVGIYARGVYARLSSKIYVYICSFGADTVSRWTPTSTNRILAPASSKGDDIR